MRTIYLFLLVCLLGSFQSNINNECFNISKNKFGLHIKSFKKYQNIKKEIYIINNISKDTAFYQVTKNNIDVFFTLKRGKYSIHSYIYNGNEFKFYKNQIKINE